MAPSANIYFVRLTIMMMNQHAWKSTWYEVNVIGTYEVKGRPACEILLKSTSFHFRSVLRFHCHYENENIKQNKSGNSPLMRISTKFSHFSIFMILLVNLYPKRVWCAREIGPIQKKQLLVPIMLTLFGRDLGKYTLVYHIWALHPFIRFPTFPEIQGKIFMAIKR